MKYIIDPIKPVDSKAAHKRILEALSKAMKECPDLSGASMSWEVEETDRFRNRL